MVVDPTGENGRVPVPFRPFLRQRGLTSDDPPWSICGEPVPFELRPGGSLINPDDWIGISDVPVGLAPWVNDINNWAARGTLLFQPTLDISMLLNAHGSRRNELARLGQAYGTDGQWFKENGNIVTGLLGGTQKAGTGYQTREVQDRLIELAPCFQPQPGFEFGTCSTEELGPGGIANDAKIQVANELAQHLDSEPWEGDFNRTGPTQNDTWGTFLKTDVALPLGMQLTSVVAYDTYDRLNDIDLDFSPETLFQILTDDEGWQSTGDVRLQGSLGDAGAVRWDVGGWLLRESLDVEVFNDLGDLQAFGVGQRAYTQDLWSAAGYLSLAFDFWERFTLDGGFRYNWEQKKLDYLLVDAADRIPAKLNDTWQAPTGTVRLTYRFREDTHVFMKYTRGWKPGTYNATSAVLNAFDTGKKFVNLSVASPEFIDAFETGVRGSWLEGRVGVDFSFFYYDYADYQIFTAQQFADGTPEFVILNANGSEVYGVEIDAVARPWIGAFMNVRFGWLESQFLDFVQLQQERISGQRVINREIQNTGNRLLNSPRFKVSLTGEQTLPLGRWGSLTARYDGVWTDTTFYDATEGRGIPNQQDIQFMPPDTIGQPAFWLHNLRLSYRLPNGQVEIAGWVRNLANTPYKTFAFDGSTFQRTSIYFVGDPRTFGGTLVVNF
jgi:outer membrane receptor protein involved in Fe transport